MLTFRNYDEAVIEFFKSFYEHSVYGSPAVAFKNAAMVYGDKVPLPLISVYRSELGLGSQRNFALFKRGNITNVTDKTVSRERILPLMLSYQADIWASENAQAAQLLSEVLFRTLDKPMFPVKCDGMEEPIQKHLQLLDVIDNSDSSQISTRGRLHRYTIVYQVDGHIAKLIENDRIFIVPEFYSYDGKELK